MTKSILPLLLFVLSACSGARSKSKPPEPATTLTAMASELAGVWAFQSSSPILCQDSSAGFKRCEVSLSLEKDLTCVLAQLNPDAQKINLRPEEIACESGSISATSPAKRTIKIFNGSQLMLSGALSVEGSEEDKTPALALTFGGKVYRLLKVSNVTKYPEKRDFLSE